MGECITSLGKFQEIDSGRYSGFQKSGRNFHEISTLYTSPNGPKLILKDYKILFSSNGDEIASAWPNLSEKIEKLAMI
ncbi:hypothetical protein TKK_0009551 [Trichogramma kaykai]|uniref:Uncharacterized protein n=1 Tax=Trichogramma kaykai TaxID=54128 RepID=A0ABD2X113_9HYME